MSQTHERRTRPLEVREVGASMVRVDGHAKVTGTAPYAVEHPTTALTGADLGPPLHAWLVQSTVARGRVTAVDVAAALAHPGVVTVLDHTNAARLVAEEGEEDDTDPELMVLQDDEVAFRGQIVAVVVAESSEAAREGAALVRVDHATERHEAHFGEDSPAYEPEEVNAGIETDTSDGDVEAGLAAAEVVIDRSYRTPHEFNNPMEPHAAMAVWEAAEDGPRLTLFDSTQGVTGVASTLAPMLGLDPERIVVRAPHVGGGFGSKGLPHAPEMAAVLAARAVPGRAVALAVTRQQMFALTGYRSATISRFRLGAKRDGTLTAVEHRAMSQTSRFKEYGEQTASPTRMMYAAPHRLTTHRLVALDVAVPSWMRAPGEMPGMYAHEVAMDELAVELGIDPIVLRERNEPTVDPETGKPFNDRRLLDCLHRGAERFGWASRPAAPRSTADGEWWVGSGVAASTYPAMVMPGNSARVRALDDGRYGVAIAAVDIGTGARTVLTQIAADALGCPTAAIELSIADTTLPSASVAGGSSGTASWGSAVVAAAQAFREEHGPSPRPGAETTAAAEDDPERENHAMHSFGAVFAEVRVHRWTGELRVPRLLGVYSVGRVVNPATARSQLVGGLTMGMSAALFEDSYRDTRFGHVVTQDLATYHIAAHADVRGIEVEWLEEADTIASPMGARGIGEIGIVGSPAAIVNAAYHATGIRIRDLPLTPDKFLDTL